MPASLCLQVLGQPLDLVDGTIHWWSFSFCHISEALPAEGCQQAEQAEIAVTLPVWRYECADRAFAVFKLQQTLGKFPADLPSYDRESQVHALVVDRTTLNDHTNREASARLLDCHKVFLA